MDNTSYRHFFHLCYDYDGYGCGYGGHDFGYVRGLVDEVDADDDCPYP